MSYDIWLETTADNVEVYSCNYTSNSAQAWRHAGADLATFDGQSAKQCAPVLERAVQRMLDDPDTYRAMDAPNKWGTYKTLVPFLTKLFEAMQENPAATVRVSH